MIKFFKNFHNEIDFFLRRNIKLSRTYNGINESKEGLFSDLSSKKQVPAYEKEKLYLEKYFLKNLKNNSTRRIYRENLAIIELLESCISVNKSKINILDIGSKNWFYAQGLYRFFKHNNFDRKISLDGIEIDAYRVYSNFYTRKDYALYYSGNLEGSSYIAKDFLKHNEKYDYITWFFPFVTEFPLLQWGLPLSTFKPLEMLRHAKNCLREGGKVLIVNQDEKEYKIQENLLRESGLSFQQKGEFENCFLDYEHKRYITVVEA